MPPQNPNFQTTPGMGEVLLKISVFQQLHGLKVSWFIFLLIYKPPVLVKNIGGEKLEIYFQCSMWKIEGVKEREGLGKGWWYNQHNFHYVELWCWRLWNLTLCNNPNPALIKTIENNQIIKAYHTSLEMSDSVFVSYGYLTNLKRHMDYFLYSQFHTRYVIGDYDI